MSFWRHFTLIGSTFLILSLIFSSAASASKDLYEILGVSRSATEKEIKASYRALAKKMRPDINLDRGTQEKFSEINNAYQILSNQSRRADYDRHGSSAFNRSAVHESHNDSKFELFKSFFDIKSFINTSDEDGFFFTGVVGRTSVIFGRVSANLTDLSVEDVITRSESYQNWQWALDQVVEVHRSDFELLNVEQNVHSIGSRVTGRNGYPIVWAGYGMMVVNIFFPTEGNTALTGLTGLALSPFAWHLGGLGIVKFRVDLQRARDCVEGFRKNILKAASVHPLVNSVAAYDFIEKSINRYLRVGGEPQRFERLTRGWILHFAKKDPRVLKGWLLRYLQDGAMPGEAGMDPSRLIDSDWNFLNQKAFNPAHLPRVLGSEARREDRQASGGHLLSDIKGSPWIWRKALTELIEDLEDFPLLRVKAQKLLTELDGQSYIGVAARNIGNKSGKFCELLLANYRAFTEPRKGY